MSKQPLSDSRPKNSDKFKWEKGDVFIEKITVEEYLKRKERGNKNVRG